MNDFISVKKVDYDYLIDFYEKYKLIEAVTKSINKYYIYEFENSNIVKWAIEGIIKNGLDSNSRWLVDNEYLNYMTNILNENNIIYSKFGIYGYIKISVFNNTVYNDFFQAYRRLQDYEIEELIIDLRYNQGGNIEECIKVLDYFVKGVLCTFIDKDGNYDTQYSTESIKDNIPLKILINNLTASASEIFACAVKYNKRGKLIGEKTMGKGTIQTLIPFDDLNVCALRLTVTEFFTPSKNKINQIGIEPDLILPDSSLKIEDLILEIKSIEIFY